MSLRFFFGPSGSGKSRQLYQEIMERSLREPKRNFFIIVPDQFTMQTQKELVTLHERGGILNIDVLSFGRLCHRIFEEVGVKEAPVLDDTGKSLVLQKVALNMKDSLPTLGGHLHKQGYIHEVKSAISEFMQYGIAPSDMPKLMEHAKTRGALLHKLKDLAALYQGFKDYIQGNFITSEETLDVLCRNLSKSELIAASVVLFDGFTGFTPIQNKVIREVIRLSEETVVSLTLGAGEDPYRIDGEQKLFYLTKKTVRDLEKLAGEAGAARGQDVFTVSGGRDRFAESPALRSLEQNLFRYETEPFTGEQDHIHLMEMTTPAQEVHQVGLKIQEMIRTKGLQYRDIALITGDLESYAPYVESTFAQLDIPCFIDRTRGIVLNPLTEYITAALQLFIRDFSYEAVFHYLRSGLADITAEEADELENYVLQTGIRGYGKWSKVFTAAGEEEESFVRLNDIRERMMIRLSCLHGRKKDTVAGYVNQLYDFLVENRVQEKLASMEERFREQGDLSRAREYAQVYRMVMDLLNQIYELLGGESISLQEFADILEAGFAEIQVGTIPQNVDRVVVGDMERTRLKQVKALFFLGVNDGNIPKSASSGGIISDMDREFLREGDMELAPTPRQQMFIQRLYLYLNMTKPSHYLYVSYVKINREGKSVRPAYLIEVLQKLFVKLTVERPENRPMLDMVMTRSEGADYLARGLRLYAQGMNSGEEEAFYTLYEAYGESEEQLALRRQLTDAAFRRYQDTGLSGKVARALYGVILENSVSRLETYAACAYHHFLQYGLSLKEREEFGFESVDMGNVFHAVLEQFADRVTAGGYTWFDFPEEFARNQVAGALEAYAARYGQTVLYSSARNEYAIVRMGRILTRTVLTLQEQLKRGAFVPDAYEMSFYSADNLESINVTLSAEEKMRLRGRIDRIDTAEDDEHVYVKVIDYKSGDRQFDLAALYYGLQLQLVVYMNAAMELEAKKHPDKEIVPAALLYYHIDDPTIESATELTEEELNGRLLEKLRMRGVVSSEEGIVQMLDRQMGTRSDVIPVERKKDGGYSARSSVMSEEELATVSEYVNHKVKKIGQEILAGRISVNPYEKGNANACTYCAYKKVCGFDAGVPGYERRVLADMDREEALKQMREEAEWQ